MCLLAQKAAARPPRLCRATGVGLIVQRCWIDIKLPKVLMRWNTGDQAARRPGGQATGQTAGRTGGRAAGLGMEPPLS